MGSTARNSGTGVKRVVKLIGPAPYVPAETMRAWWTEQVDPTMNRRTRQREVLERKRRVELLFHPPQSGGLSAEARHRFNFKKGLRGDLPHKTREVIFVRKERMLIDEDLDPVFRNIRQDVRDSLTTGFPGLAEAFSTKGAIQEDALRREVDPSEREQLLTSLFSRL
jgi:hypothetical protein